MLSGHQTRWPNDKMLVHPTCWVVQHLSFGRALRSQSDCAEVVLAASVKGFSVLVDVPVEHSMNGRSSSESLSITLDNFALLIRLTCTCSSMSSSLFFSLERFDSAKPGV